MSDSRLEKFIYAICSMDVSDLPVPLSRIEKLWNCLITGETPDFEPLSRNEKYLMAMLDRYDISNLPAPMSRGEKLLYKIAVGETDLSDVPGYLSRYEELLKYLIENGGISEGDFKYVLHTLNQSLSTLYSTAEKPVKSAILKGQTLVNLCNNVAFSKIDAQYGFWEEIPNALRVNIIKDKKYFIRANVETNSFIDGGQALRLKNEAGEVQWTILNLNQKQGLVSGNFTAEINGTIVQALSESFSNTGSLVIKEIIIIEYQDGMENWDIPYFEGMQSVKMPVLTTTGKNLFDESKILKRIWNAPFVNGNPISPVNGDNLCSSGRIKVKKGESYVISGNNIIREVVTYYKTDDISEYPFDGIQAKNSRFTSLHDGYIEWYLTNDNVNNPVSNVQIEKGTVSTSYEPYKSNILTVNEEVELRGIGDVQDTLDVLTGEVTQRIGEVVFDGSEDWAQSVMDPSIFYISINDMAHKENYQNSISCDKFVTYIGEAYLRDSTLLNGITGYIDNTDTYPNENWIYIKYADSEGYVEKLKQCLSQNPITIQYELATESVKTVDLTVVDQDGQPTELKTFNDITHVEIKADNLIPAVDLEVATKISETLSTIETQQLDISETQDQLSQTIDEQAENTDATMMATTEIYEQTL